MAKFLFWVSAALLPINLYFVAYGSLSPAISALAAALNGATMIQMTSLMP